MNVKRGFLQHSLLLKLGGTLALIACFSILGMASSGIIAESVQGSGEAINLAGSLRMQTYKMTSLALSARLPEGGDVSAPLRKAIDAFDATLTDARITSVMSDQVETDLANSYVTVRQTWQRMKPRLLEEANSSRPIGPDSTPLLQEVSLFVDEINILVKQIEQDTEAKIRVLRMVLGAALLMTLLVGALTLVLARNDLILPLRDLLSFAANLGRGNLAVRTEHTGNDELGRLGQAFNHMAEDLSRSYQHLEARVEEKTAELTIANRSLELLYHSIARLYNGPVAHDTYAILLKDLENVLGVGHGQACLVETGEEKARVIASTPMPPTRMATTTAAMPGSTTRSIAASRASGWTILSATRSPNCPMYRASTASSRTSAIRSIRPSITPPAYFAAASSISLCRTTAKTWKRQRSIARCSLAWMQRA